MTSLDQINHDHQAWKDRHDVHKAFEEWAKENYAYKHTTLSQGTITAIIKTAKDFALFFAERVKGAPIQYKPQSMVHRCEHCKRPFYPHLSEATRNEFFCCAACENGY